MDSLVLNESVMVSPTTADVVFELLDEMVRVERVGAVRSKLTALPSVVDVTLEPVFFDVSEKLETEKATLPSESLLESV